MKTEKRDWMQFISENIINQDVSYRGGSLKFSVKEIFPEVSEPVMGAYQNYLGGGIAGAVQGAAMFSPAELSVDRTEAEYNEALETFKEILEAAKRYFYNLNNGGGDDYMQENYGDDYDFNQNLPSSAY